MFYGGSRTLAYLDERSYGYTRGQSYNYSTDLSRPPRNLSLQRVLNSESGRRDRSLSPSRDYSSSSRLTSLRTLSSDPSPTLRRKETSSSKSFRDNRASPVTLLSDDLNYSSKPRHYYDFSSHTSGLFSYTAIKKPKRTDYSDYLRPVLVDKPTLKSNYIPKYRANRGEDLNPITRDRKLIKFRETSDEVLEKIRRRMSWDLPEEISSPFIDAMKQIDEQNDDKFESEPMRSRENSLKRSSQDIVNIPTETSMSSSPRHSLSRQPSGDTSFEKSVRRTMRKSSRTNSLLMSPIEAINDPFCSNPEEALLYAKAPKPPPRKKSIGAPHKHKKARKSSVEILLSDEKTQNYSKIAADIRRSREISESKRKSSADSIEENEQASESEIEVACMDAASITDSSECSPDRSRRRRRRISVRETHLSEETLQENRNRSRSRVKSRDSESNSPPKGHNHSSHDNCLDEAPHPVSRMHRKSVKYKADGLSGRRNSKDSDILPDSFILPPQKDLITTVDTKKKGETIVKSNCNKIKQEASTTLLNQNIKVESKLENSKKIIDNEKAVKSKTDLEKIPKLGAESNQIKCAPKKVEDRNATKDITEINKNLSLAHSSSDKISNIDKISINDSKTSEAKFSSLKMEVKKELETNSEGNSMKILNDSKSNKISEAEKKENLKALTQKGRQTDQKFVKDSTVSGAETEKKFTGIKSTHNSTIESKGKAIETEKKRVNEVKNAALNESTDSNNSKFSNQKPQSDAISKLSANASVSKEPEEIIVVYKLPQPKRIDFELAKIVTPVEPKVIVSIKGPVIRTDFPLKKSEQTVAPKVHAIIPSSQSSDSKHSGAKYPNIPEICEVPDVNVTHTIVLKPKVQNKSSDSQISTSDKVKENGVHLKSIPDVIKSTVNSSNKVSDISDIVKSTLSKNGDQSKENVLDRKSENVTMQTDKTSVNNLKKAIGQEENTSLPKPRGKDKLPDINEKRNEVKKTQSGSALNTLNALSISSSNKGKCNSDVLNDHTECTTKNLKSTNFSPMSDNGREATKEKSSMKPDLIQMTSEKVESKTLLDTLTNTLHSKPLAEGRKTFKIQSENPIQTENVNDTQVKSEINNKLPSILNSNKQQILDKSEALTTNLLGNEKNIVAENKFVSKNKIPDSKSADISISAAIKKESESDKIKVARKNVAESLVEETVLSDSCVSKTKTKENVETKILIDRISKNEDIGKRTVPETSSKESGLKIEKCGLKKLENDVVVKKEFGLEKVQGDNKNINADGINKNEVNKDAFAVQVKETETQNNLDTKQVSQVKFPGEKTGKPGDKNFETPKQINGKNEITFVKDLKIDAKKKPESEKNQLNFTNIVNKTESISDYSNNEKTEVKVDFRTKDVNNKFSVCKEKVDEKIKDNKTTLPDFNVKKVTDDAEMLKDKANNKVLTFDNGAKKSKHTILAYKKSMTSPDIVLEDKVSVSKAVAGKLEPALSADNCPSKLHEESLLRKGDQIIEKKTEIKKVNTETVNSSNKIPSRVSSDDAEPKAETQRSALLNKLSTSVDQENKIVHQESKLKPKIETKHDSDNSKVLNNLPSIPETKIKAEQKLTGAITKTETANKVKPESPIIKKKMTENLKSPNSAEMKTTDGAKPESPIIKKKITEMKVADGVRPINLVIEKKNTDKVKPTTLVTEKKTSDEIKLTTKEIEKKTTDEAKSVTATTEKKTTDEAKSVSPTTEKKTTDEAKSVTPITEKKITDEVKPTVLITEKKTTDEIKPIIPLTEKKTNEIKPVIPLTEKKTTNGIKPVIPVTEKKTTNEIKPVIPVTEKKTTNEIKPMIPVTEKKTTNEIKPVIPVTEKKTTNEIKSVIPVTEKKTTNEIKPVIPVTEKKTTNEIKPVIPVTEKKTTNEIKPVIPVTEKKTTNEIKPVIPVTEKKITDKVKSTPVAEKKTSDEIKLTTKESEKKTTDEAKFVTLATERKTTEEVNPATLEAEKKTTNEIKPIIPLTEKKTTDEIKPISPLTENKAIDETKPIIPVTEKKTSDEIRPTTQVTEIKTPDKLKEPEQSQLTKDKKPKLPPIPPQYKRFGLFVRPKSPPKTIMESSSEEESETETESSSEEEEEATPVINKVSKLANECNVTCHQKCEKFMPNLCGVNQKLLSEVLDKVKKGKYPDQNEKTRTRSETSITSNSTTYSTVPASWDDEYGSPKKAVKSKRLKFRKYGINDFTFLKLLGKGSFGKVLLAELKENDTYFAIKCLKKDVVLEDDDVESTMIERRVLALGTQHPYMCKLYCTFQSESYLYFVMEYLNGGDLMFHIQESGRFEEKRAMFYGAEIVSALKFLHKRGIVYRDIKLDNIILDEDGHVHLVDFGMCKTGIVESNRTSTFCGTPDYIPPEIVMGKTYDQSVDWWSFGVLLYEMLIGRSPFQGTDEDELFWSICNEEPQYPRFLSKEALHILGLLLVKAPAKRLGMPGCPAGEIKDHAFFSTINWDKIETKQLAPSFRPKVSCPSDTSNFDRSFTMESASLDPIESDVLKSMDQEQFNGFSYTNPHLTG